MLHYISETDNQGNTLKITQEMSVVYLESNRSLVRNGCHAGECNDDNCTSAQLPNTRTFRASCSIPSALVLQASPPRQLIQKLIVWKREFWVLVREPAY